MPDPWTVLTEFAFPVVSTFAMAGCVAASAALIIIFRRASEVPRWLLNAHTTLSAVGFTTTLLSVIDPFWWRTGVVFTALILAGSVASQVYDRRWTNARPE